MKLTPKGMRLSARAEKRSVIATLMVGLLLIGWLAEPPLELDSALYDGLWRSIFVALGPFVTPLPVIRMYPWQLLLIALVPFCLRNSSSTRQHGHELDHAILVGVACIAITFLWGCFCGGSPYFAYYQLWPFMAGLLIAYALKSAILTERDLISLGKAVVLAGVIRATLCIYFYWVHLHGKIHPLPEYVTDHDDSMLFALTTLIVLLWAVLKRQRTAWTIAALIVPVIFYAMVLNNRRLAWVELGLALPPMYFLISAGRLRSRINRCLIVTVPLLLVFFAVGAKSNSPVFAPVHALMTTDSNQNASSLARMEENRNLMYTLVDFGNPLLGTGWGRPYQRETSVYDNFSASWILAPYTPHNSLLGLVVFSGLVGLIGIWGVVPMGAYLAARGYRRSTTLVSRTAAMAALSALVVYSVQCFGDIGLQSFPGALIFGAALATAGKVGMSSEALPSARAATTRAGRESPALEQRPRHPGSPWRSSQRSGSSDGTRPEATPSRAPTRRAPR